MDVHPMKVVVRKTGLTPDVLRVWEKRYGVVQPTRSAGGQRLYSTADVERLGLLKRATDLGRSIGRIARLSPEELRRLIAEDRPVAAEGGSAVRHDALAAIERMDGEALEALLRRAAMTASLTALTDEIVGPLLLEVGERWHAGTLRPSQEHLATAVIRRILFWAVEAGAPPAGAPAVVVSTPAGQRHELGALLSLAAATAAGWRGIYLGSDLPATDLADALSRTGAGVLALSLVHPAGDEALARDLVELRRLAPSATILAGGGAAGSYGETLDRIGAVICPDLQAFRHALGTLVATSS